MNYFNKMNEDFEEIVRRVKIGQRFINETVANMPLFKLKKPQEPPEVDYPEGERNKRGVALDPIAFRHDKKMARYNRLRSKYDDAMTDYNNKIANKVIEKNIKIFHEYIRPLVAIPWGSIPASNIRKIDKVNDVMRDVTKNTKDFEGIRIFTTTDDVISLVYVQKGGLDHARIVYVNDRNSDNPIVDSPEAIEHEVYERRAVLRGAVDVFFNDLLFKAGDLPEYSKKFGNPTVKTFLLYCFYWKCASSINAMEVARPYLDKIFRYPSGASIDELMSGIFDECKRDEENGDSVIYKFYNNGRLQRTIAFNPKGGAQKQYFAEKIAEEIEGNEIEFIQKFDISFLRNILDFIAFREKDKFPNYGYGSIANYNKLTTMIFDDLDVDIRHTPLKALSGDYKDPDSAEGTYVYDTLLLFADCIDTEYVIKVKVDVEISKLANMSIYRNIKSYRENRDSYIDYDPETRTRTKKKIEISDEQAMALDALRNINDVYMGNGKEKKGININKVLSIAEKEFPRNSTEYKLFDDCLRSIPNFISSIVSYVRYDSDSTANDELWDCIDEFNEIIECLDWIFANSRSYDSSELRDCIRSIYKKVANIQRIYNNLIKGYVGIKRMARISTGWDDDRRDNELLKEFKNIVDYITTNFDTIKDIADDIDFGNVSRSVINTFRTKDDFIAMIDACVEGVLGFGNNLINSKNASSISDILNEYRKLADEIKSLGGRKSKSNDKLAATLLRIYNVASAICDESDKYSSSQTGGATFAI